MNTGTAKLAELLVTVFSR